MKTKTKALDLTRVSIARVKAESGGGGDSPTRTVFKGYASVFDVMDSYGDVVRRGAFAEAVKAFGKAGDGGVETYGIYYVHQMSGSPYGLVGRVKSIIEDGYGLLVEGELYDDVNPEAKFLGVAMKDGAIGEMSFAYYVTEGGWATQDGQEVYEIKAVDLLEVSVCPVGVNRSALIQEVKSRIGDPTPRAKAIEDLDPDAEADPDAEGDADPDEDTEAITAEEVAAMIEAALIEHGLIEDPEAEGDDPPAEEDEDDSKAAGADGDSEGGKSAAEKAVRARVAVATALANTN